MRKNLTTKHINNNNNKKPLTNRHNFRQDKNGELSIDWQ